MFWCLVFRLQHSDLELILAAKREQWGDGSSFFDMLLSVLEESCCEIPLSLALLTKVFIDGAITLNENGERGHQILLDSS